MDNIYDLGTQAQELLTQQEMLMSRYGGITPQQLQEMAGTWGDTVNHGFEVRSVPQLLHDLAVEYDAVLTDGYEITIQEFSAALVLTAMHLAHRNVFDLYEATYEYLNLTLNNVVTIFREERARRANS